MKTTLNITWEAPVNDRLQVHLNTELRLLGSLQAERRDVACAVRLLGFGTHVGGRHVAVLQGRERVALITGEGGDWN